ncbi:hypothetical protein ACQP1P_37145 [Dactylosporangium sp. CA-052675]|uniref:hypothetical protein n=1 Tax=Dactylosporangium sp. CA-052675 TaxID=3239927 RepID=UPI003D935A6C
MEPENGQDQVNGSPPPPKPKSRRGWMSDSPLDGGSGWPTSAYAIVPRQPGPPKAEETAAEPASKPAPAPEPAPPPEAEPQPSRKGRIGVLIIGLVVLVIAAVGGVLATRETKPDNKNQTETVAAPGPTTEPALPVVVDSGSSRPSTATTASAQTSAGPSLAGSAGASAETTVPAAPPSTAILRAGTAQFVVLAGQPDDAYDFDSGIKQAAGADATAGAIGITAANGAKFALLLSADTPSLAACSALPEDRWVSQVVIGSLVPGARVCMRTSEGRYAWFMTRAGALVTGALYTSNLDFVVYKKSGD